MGDVELGLAYNRSIVSWRESISEFEEACQAQGEATADYKRARGKFIVRRRMEESKISAVALEAAADADDEVGELLAKRLIADSYVDALKQRLIWHRANADNLRTQVVDEREQNRLASQTGAGPGTQVQPAYSPPAGRGRPPAGRTGSGGYDRPQDDPWGGSGAYTDADAPPERDWERGA